MYYLYPTSNAYIYCLPYHPVKKDASDFRYLSIRKVGDTRFTIGETILLLYRKGKTTPPGIIGFCKVAGELTKAREIPAEEQKFCFDRTYLQLPVSNLQCGVSSNMIDEDVMYSLPIMNEYGKMRVFSEYNLVNVYAPILYTLMEYRKFWFVWRAARTELEVQQYKELFIHLEREKIDHEKYLKLSEHVKQCTKCGFEHPEFASYTPRFFQFHEVPVHTIGKYVKRDFDKFIPLCPNCHKKEHEQIVSQCFNDRSFGPQGFSFYGLLGGWNRDYFNEEFEL